MGASDEMEKKTKAASLAQLLSAGPGGLRGAVRRLAARRVLAWVARPFLLLLLLLFNLGPVLGGSLGDSGSVTGVFLARMQRWILARIFRLSRLPLPSY
jgi:hypothetical protein